MKLTKNLLDVNTNTTAELFFYFLLRRISSGLKISLLRLATHTVTSVELRPYDSCRIK
jgi:hypothetical protein